MRQTMAPQFNVQYADERYEIDIKSRKPISKLNEVQPTLAALDVANGCLASPQQDRKIRLA